MNTISMNMNAGKIAPGFRAAAVALAILAAACSEGRIVKVTPAPEAPAFSAAREENWKRADSLWELRRDPGQAWASLISYRRASEDQPQVPDLWTRYARACYFVATYTEQNQEWSNPERPQALYLEGARAADAALRLHPEYARALAEGGDEADAVRNVDGSWLRPAFWLAANQGRWALKLSEARRPREDRRGRLEVFVRNIAARNDTLYFGGLHRFLGVLYLVPPNTRPDSARAEFGRADVIAPLYFANRTLRAEYLAVRDKDTAAFRELLESVIQTPADALPEAAIENEYEQAHARNLLSRQAELFP